MRLERRAQVARLADQRADRLEEQKAPRASAAARTGAPRLRELGQSVLHVLAGGDLVYLSPGASPTTQRPVRGAGLYGAGKGERRIAHAVIVVARDVERRSVGEESAAQRAAMPRSRKASIGTRPQTGRAGALEVVAKSRRVALQAPASIAPMSSSRRSSRASRGVCRPERLVAEARAEMREVGADDE